MNKSISIIKSSGKKLCMMMSKWRENSHLSRAVTDLIEVVEVEESPLAYPPGNATRLRVKIVGNLV